MISKKYSIQMFADGAAATAGATATATTADTGSSTQGAENTVGTEAGNSREQAQKKPFKDLIRGDYKEDYEKSLMKRMKGVNSRLEAAEARNKQLQPALEKLAVKYGISDPNDIDSIMAQIDKDNSYYEAYATEHGVTIEDARTLVEAEKINRENRIREENELKNQQFNEQMKQIVEQGAQVQAKYPSFDLDTEMQDDTFRRLVFTGISVEDAYTVRHRDELMSGAMAYTYQQAQQDFANTQRANAGRPQENGTSAQQAAQVTDDMSKLSREQVEKIKLAVGRGERVTPDNFRNYL